MVCVRYGDMSWGNVAYANVAMTALEGYGNRMGYLDLPMILSMMTAMAPSPVTLQAVPKLSIAM